MQPRTSTVVNPSSTDLVRESQPQSADVPSGAPTPVIIGGCRPNRFADLAPSLDAGWMERLIFWLRKRAD